MRMSWLRSRCRGRCCPRPRSRTPPCPRLVEADPAAVGHVRRHPHLQALDPGVAVLDQEDGRPGGRLQPVLAGVPPPGMALARPHLGGRGGRVDADVVGGRRRPAAHRHRRRVGAVAVARDVHHDVRGDEVRGGVEVLDGVVDRVVLVLGLPVEERRVGAVDVHRRARDRRLRGAAGRRLDRVDGVGGPAVDEGQVVGGGDLVLEHVAHAHVRRHGAAEGGRGARRSAPCGSWCSGRWQ